MEDLSCWEVAGSVHFTCISSQGGNDIISSLCPAMPGSKDSGPKSQRHQKGFNLKNSRSVQCQLSLNSHPPTITSTTVLSGFRSRSGVERELNQGFSSYKSPSTPTSEQQQAEKNKSSQKGTASLFSAEAWLLLQTNSLGRKENKSPRGRNINWKLFVCAID